MVSSSMHGAATGRMGCDAAVCSHSSPGMPFPLECSFHLKRCTALHIESAHGKGSSLGTQVAWRRMRILLPHSTFKARATRPCLIAHPCVNPCARSDECMHGVAGAVFLTLRLLPSGALGHMGARARHLHGHFHPLSARFLLQWCGFSRAFAHGHPLTSPEPSSANPPQPPASAQPH